MKLIGLMAAAVLVLAVPRAEASQYPHCTPGPECHECCANYAANKCWACGMWPDSPACGRCVQRYYQECFNSHCVDPALALYYAWFGTQRIPNVCEWCNEAWPTHCSQCCHLCAEQTCDEYCEEFPLLCDLCDHDEIYHQCLWEHCYDREIALEAILPYCTPGPQCSECCWDWAESKCWISCQDPLSEECGACAWPIYWQCFQSKCMDPACEAIP